MEIVNANFVWKLFMEIKHGNRECKVCMEIVYGNCVWKSCMEIVYGNRVWKFGRWGTDTDFQRSGEPPLTGSRGNRSEVAVTACP